jgi:ABC-type antimicrobial peptide transport system permease subunit
MTSRDRRGPVALAVLFVACANVAGLLTSRAPVRAREMALRLAIGAGRQRLARQLITESLLVALAGGVAGLGVGYAGMMLFKQIELPTEPPILLAVPDGLPCAVFLRRSLPLRGNTSRCLMTT